MRYRRPRENAVYDSPERRVYVYRLNNAAGDCLYIGRSVDPVARLRAHLSNTTWASQVMEVEANGPHSWAESVVLERESIKREQPPHNIMHTPRWRSEVS